MFGKKCPSCAKKIEGKFNFCPHCGESFKKAQEEEKYGILGREDSIDLVKTEEAKLPFGMDKILNSLMKQLEKQMNQAGNEGGMPKGFQIKISTAKPQNRQMLQEKKLRIINNFSDEQLKEKIKLPKIEAESKIKRLSDRLIYEINIPGVKSQKEVVITELASGFEIKAYSDDKCYTKFIPFKVELIQYYLDKEKLFIELKI